MVDQEETLKNVAMAESTTRTITLDIPPNAEDAFIGQPEFVLPEATLAQQWVKLNNGMSEEAASRYRDRLYKQRTARKQVQKWGAHKVSVQNGPRSLSVDPSYTEWSFAATGER